MICSLSGSLFFNNKEPVTSRNSTGKILVWPWLILGLFVIIAIVAAAVLTARRCRQKPKEVSAGMILYIS